MNVAGTAVECSLLSALNMLMLTWLSVFHVGSSIVTFVSDFKRRGLPLHVLVENAGVFLVPHDRTQEGFETTVGTNYFGEQR